MKRFTKALSMLLAIIMVVGLLPLSVIAEDIHNTHTVQFKLKYNGAHKIPSQKVADGECAVQPENVTREGWIFEYWYVKTDDNGIQKFDLSQPITEDVTLYARWDEDIEYWGPIWNRNILGAIEDSKDDEKNSDGFYTVTFDANADGVVGMPENQKVAAGECAIEPDAPTKDGYVFGGWYKTTIDIGTPFDFSEPISEDIILYAKWTHDNSLEYGIGDVSFEEEDNTFYVSINAQHNVNLNIHIQDENMTTILHQGTVNVDIVEYLTQVSYTPDDYIVPEFFVLTITLTDDDNILLCEPYTTIEFTQKYKKSISKTIDDFDIEKVVNLDEQNDTNFIVARDGIDVIILPDTVYIDYNEETQVYILSGDIDLLDIENSTELIIKDDNTVYLIDVGSITKNDNTIEIIENSNVDYKDFFSYIKINDSAYGVQNPESKQNLRRINAPMSRSSVPDIDVDLEPEIEVKFNKKFEEDGIGYSQYYGEVDLTGSAKAFLRILYDIVLLGEDYIEIEIGFTIDATATANVGVKIEDNPIGDDELKLGGLSFPFGTSGVFFMADVYVPLDWKISGELEISANAQYSIKRVYNTLSGWTPINHDPKASISFLDAEAHVEMFWGLKIDIGVYFLNSDFLSISAPCKAGVMVEATVGSEFSSSTTGIKHECILCANGTFYPKIELLIEAEYHINKFLDGKFGVPIKVFDFSNLKKFFYVSLINKETSVHGGKLTFGFGNCPNVSYRASFSAIDFYGNEYNTKLNMLGNFHMSDGVSVSKYELVETKYLPDSVNLFNGSYVASSEIEGNRYARNITISNASQKINILEYTVKGNIKRDETNAGVSDATVTVYLRDGTEIDTYKTGTSTSSGMLDTTKTKFNLPVGYSTIYVKVEYKGCLPYYTAFSIPNTTGILDLGTIDLEKRSQNQSSISGIIVDTHDKALSDVIVELYNSTGELVYNTVADANGVYNFAVDLSDGQYSLNFVKSGYAYNKVLPKIIISGAPQTSYSVVVLDESGVVEDGYIVTGIIHDSDNKPIQGVRVEISNAVGENIDPVYTDINGKFILYQSAPYSYTLRFIKDGYQSSTMIQPANTTDIGIKKLDSCYTVKGVVVNEKDTGLENAIVQVLNADGSLNTREFSAFDGSFVFELVDTGTYSLYITMDNYGDTSYEFSVNERVTNVGRIPMKADTAMYTVSGKVTTDGTTALKGVTVSIFNTKEPTTQYTPITTAADGTYSFNVPNGTYTLTFTKANYKTQTTNVIVQDGAKTVETITMPLSTDFSVTHPDIGDILAASPIEMYNGVASMTWTINSSHDWTVTKSGDWFTIDKTGGKAGETVTMKINITNYTDSQNTATITFKVGDTEYKVNLVQKASHLKGWVVSGLNQPIEGAVVTVSNGEKSWNYTTGANGVFDIAVPNAFYTISVTAAGFESKTYDRDVQVNGEDVDIGEILLTKSIIASLTGTIRDGDADSPTYGQVLEGVSLDVYDSTGKKVGDTAKSNENGVVAFDFPAAGTYKFVFSLVGYKTVTVDAVIINENTPSLGQYVMMRAEEKTSVSGTTSPGTKLELLDENGNVLAETVADEDGRYEFKDIPGWDGTIFIIRIKDTTLTTEVIGGATDVVIDAARVIFIPTISYESDVMLENADGASTEWEIETSHPWTVTKSGDTSWYTLNTESGNAGISDFVVTAIGSTDSYRESTLTFALNNRTFDVTIYQNFVKTVSGSVVEQTENSAEVGVENVKLVVRKADDSSLYSQTETNVNGQYTLVFEDAGEYVITYTHPEYNTVTVEGIVITADSASFDEVKMTAKSIIDNGECGDNLEWTLYEDYTLVISGTGDMYDYQYESDSYSTAPWSEYCELIKHIACDTGITSIGNYAFYKCIAMEDINLPNTIESIGHHAFQYCSSLVAVTIPGKVRSIEAASFEYCSSLRNVILPYTLTYIGGWAFKDCGNLSSFYLPEQLEYIGEYVFWNSEILNRTIYLPAKLNYIGTDAFAFTGVENIYVDDQNKMYSDIDGVLFNKDKTVLIRYPKARWETSYTIPQGVVKIGSWGIAQTRLTEIILPSTLEIIGYGGIWNNSLNSLIIPESVTEIHDRAFEYSSPLKNIYFMGNSPTVWGSNVTSKDYSTTINYIAGKSGWTSPTWTAPDGTVYNTATFVPEEDTESPSMSGTCGDNLTWTLDDQGTLTISGVGTMENWDGWSNVIPWNEYRNSIISVVIEEGVTNIGDGSFTNHDFLKTVEISTTVSIIGDSVFAYCDALEVIDIPANVSSIGDNVFEKCTSLQEVNVDGNNSKYRSIDGVLYDKNLTVLIVYPTAKNETHYSIPQTVIAIEEAAFYGCLALTSIDIPEGVTHIKVNTFRESGLVSIVLPDSITDIDSSAFSHCKALKSIIIPDNVNTIGYGAFWGCSALTSIVLPDNITVLDGSVLRECTSLVNVSLPDNLMQIENDAFYGCSSLREITIPEKVFSIGSWALWSCQNIYFLGDAPTTVGEYDVFTFATLHYISGKSGWTSPTWTAPDGTVYNTATWNPENTN